MIGVRINSADSQPLYLFGITRMNVERLMAGEPIKLDIPSLGGTDSVGIFYGDTAEELRAELAKISTAEELARLTPVLDQLGAMEAEVAARRKPSSPEKEPFDTYVIETAIDGPAHDVDTEVEVRLIGKVTVKPRPGITSGRIRVIDFAGPTARRVADG